MRFKEFVGLPVITGVIIAHDGNTSEVLHEGKWIPGRFDRNIRIDRPTHGAGQTHAHVLGRRGEEIGIVNFDGSGSHGTKCRLSNDDADALRARGFQIQPGNIVEWVLVTGEHRLLLG